MSRSKVPVFRCRGLGFTARCEGRCFPTFRCVGCGDFKALDAAVMDEGRYKKLQDRSNKHVQLHRGE